MSNFAFLNAIPAYKLFAPSAIEAERVYHTSPAMCVIGCRKALELAVKWVYSADKTMQMPYRDNLQSLIHEDTFRYSVDNRIWNKLRIIIRNGNEAVHTSKAVTSEQAIVSLRWLFEFIEWIDYCYGEDYEERFFSESSIPKERVVVDTKKVKEQESLLGEKDAVIKQLRKQIESLSAQYTAQKEEHQNARPFHAESLSEYNTRKIFIDSDLRLMGWQFTGTGQDVVEEYEVNDMMGISGQKGYVDYVLLGKDGKPLAVIEAKKTSADPNKGLQQAKLYADCLERKFSRRPVIFTTNGFETYFWDDLQSPQRRVSMVFCKDDIQRLINRRSEKKNLTEIPINPKITDRYYQIEAIRAVCDHVTAGGRKNLLVMATGTGKTRTAASAVDVLSRGGYATNILFLADRTALVQQAKDSFRSYLPDMSLCNLCSNKDDRNARVIFSTYPTMLNAINSARTPNGVPLFTPAHFDLIIVDESHRSIFKKYSDIFSYFDAILIGLTATPKTDVDRNTYDFFEVEHGVPTYAYDYETAVQTDHVLVPYYNYEVRTKFIEEGISYDDLSDEDKERYESDFAEDGEMPEFVTSAELNRFVFNQQTVDMVLQDLMERGIRIEGGDKLGKSIIFAQNKRHADYIVERFNALYPQYMGKFARRVICDDAYAQTVIDEFKSPAKMPQIAVSVDMMDTGIDVPECVNLVFFKVVKSKTKFWQMIGRGTRLAPELTCMDQIDGEYTGKRRFLIFDYCGNFAFFREKPNGFDAKETKTLEENIFIKKIRIASGLQDSAYAEEKYQSWRQEIVTECCSQVKALNRDLISVKLNLRLVEKYSELSAFTVISDGDRTELTGTIAPLVYMKDTDEMAKRFDNFMYGLILAVMEGKGSVQKAKKQLQGIGTALSVKVSIPQVNAKLPLIVTVSNGTALAGDDICQFEEIRKELHDLIKFIVNGGERKIIYTSLTDPILDSREGEGLAPAYDFEDYRKKVNRYVEEHQNAMSIYKLKHNIPLTRTDYEELERVLTEELGTKEDYSREFGDTPFGLMIRKIGKMDHEATMEVFAEFINNQAMNQRQIVFLQKVVNYIEQNGYMDSVTELQKPPFDKPVSFVKLFDFNTRKRIIDLINQVKDNAVNIA